MEECERSSVAEHWQLKPEVSWFHCMGLIASYDNWTTTNPHNPLYVPDNHSVCAVKTLGVDWGITRCGGCSVVMAQW